MVLQQLAIYMEKSKLWLILKLTENEVKKLHIKGKTIKYPEGSIRENLAKQEEDNLWQVIKSSIHRRKKPDKLDFIEIYNTCPSKEKSLIPRIMRYESTETVKFTESRMVVARG